ncbi:hypothetical protein V8E54_007516 [Elaphomyces granulatus]
MIIIQECNSVAATALEEFYGTNDFDIVYIDDKVTFSENAKEGYSTQDIPLQEDLEDSQKEIVLLKLWMEFIYSERSRSGMCGLLPKMGKGNCECEGSRMAYPHWPPTSFEEATEQFDYCMQQRNTHRRYLANSWWIFFNKLGFQETADKRKMCEEKAALIESNCAYFQEELVKEENRITKRPNGWRCFEYCEPKIREKAWDQKPKERQVATRMVHFGRIPVPKENKKTQSNDAETGRDDLGKEQPTVLATFEGLESEDFCTKNFIFSSDQANMTNPTLRMKRP